MPSSSSRRQQSWANEYTCWCCPLVGIFFYWPIRHQLTTWHYETIFKIWQGLHWLCNEFLLHPMRKEMNNHTNYGHSGKGRCASFMHDEFCRLSWYYMSGLPYMSKEIIKKYWNHILWHMNNKNMQIYKLLGKTLFVTYNI